MSSSASCPGRSARATRRRRCPDARRCRSPTWPRRWTCCSARRSSRRVGPPAPPRCTPPPAPPWSKSPSTSRAMRQCLLASAALRGEDGPLVHLPSTRAPASSSRSTLAGGASTSHDCSTPRPAPAPLLASEAATAGGARMATQPIFAWPQPILPSRLSSLGRPRRMLVGGVPAMEPAPHCTLSLCMPVPLAESLSRFACRCPAR
mmetsp:Transcript_31531/g.104349  ORF Transcript_31531/g.104349 Transcript_31531/m.104349 type:complete len:205 (+) Transcript_31531:261-875(+)